MILRDVTEDGDSFSPPHPSDAQMNGVPLRGKGPSVRALLPPVAPEILLLSFPLDLCNIPLMLGRPAVNTVLLQSVNMGL